MGYHYLLTNFNTLFFSHKRFVNGTRLDDRLIRVDWDAGFVEGRQYGRGKTADRCEMNTARITMPAAGVMANCCHRRLHPTRTIASY